VRWLWIMRQHELEQLLPLIPAADAIYAYFPLIKPEFLKRLRSSQILVVFAEVTRDTEEAWNYTVSHLQLLKDAPVTKILVTSTDTEWERISREIGASWFPIWTTPPWVFNYKPSTPKESFFVFYCRDDADKGQDVVKPLVGRLPIVVIGAYQLGRGFVSLNETLQLQARSFSLLFPSRDDSVSRMLTCAVQLEQVPILLKSRGCHWRNYTFGWTDDEFLRVVPWASSEQEFVELAERAFMNPRDFHDKYAPAIKQFFDKHRQFWDPWLIWERWIKQFGFPLPADLIPLHNIPWIDRWWVEALPDGPWKNQQPSLNLRA